jgi:hypothetical protein
MLQGEITLGRLLSSKLRKRRSDPTEDPWRSYRARKSRLKDSEQKRRQRAGKLTGCGAGCPMRAVQDFLPWLEIWDTEFVSRLMTD